MSQDTVKTRAHPELRVKAGLRAPEHEVTPEPEEPPREEIPRIVRLLALAHRWHRLIDEGEIESQAEIARRVGLTRARVTQIMNLRWLSPRLQMQLVDSRSLGEICDGLKVFGANSQSYWPAQSKRSHRNERSQPE